MMAMVSIERRSRIRPNGRRLVGGYAPDAGVGVNL
jgi:hypothetical protein